jgi:hypothetical protein
MAGEVPVRQDQHSLAQQRKKLDRQGLLRRRVTAELRGDQCSGAALGQRDHPHLGEASGQRTAGLRGRARTSEPGPVRWRVLHIQGGPVHAQHPSASPEPTRRRGGREGTGNLLEQQPQGQRSQPGPGPRQGLLRRDHHRDPPRRPRQRPGELAHHPTAAHVHEQRQRQHVVHDQPGRQHPWTVSRFQPRRTSRTGRAPTPEAQTGYLWRGGCGRTSAVCWDRPVVQGLSSPLTFARNVGPQCDRYRDPGASFRRV